ncbi:NACHT and WD40 domain protein [Penicillium angulare]|uniref:NACHT and WD40 domain protein n=1 Tax=Penicillium angulare TaxID=116970 RepID=UPI00253FCDCA|nr:NACHT and WD40 domain protein [Penicillium angulare]KAJ5272303.1 NACHT and WD40 domain protein [Penicillium angulare]
MNRYPVVAELLRDAQHYFLMNSQLLDETPLQIYFAGLIFAPHESITRETFEQYIPSCICRLPETETAWDTKLQFLEGHSDYVASVKFSYDNQILASGSFNQMMRLWGAKTGALRHTLKEHLDVVKSGSFSPDGQLLASGSRDKALRIWDIATGALQQTIEGHSEDINSVSISPDSCLVTTGSDNIVRLWNIIAGELQQTLDGYSKGVNLVAFSPNGQLVVSGCDYRTVRLWDLAKKLLAT